MDERKNRTITIKINGKDRQAEEHPAIIESKDVETEKEKSAVNPAPRNHLGEAEKIEQQTIEQSAAAHEEQFDWILPKNNNKPPPISLKKPTKSSSKKMFKGSKGSFKNSRIKKLIIPLLFIISIAILVGTSFGLVMLKMINSEEGAGTETVSSGGAPVNSKEGGNGSLTAKPISSFIIQGGVFETKESAERGLTAAVEKGTSAVLVEKEGKIYLFLGVAESLDMAKVLGGQLEEGIDFFTKEVTFGTTGKAELLDEEITLLIEASSLYETLSALSANGMTTGNIPPQLKETMLGKQEKWKEINSESIETTKVQEIKTEIDEAIKKFTRFEENGDENLLAGIQQHLLNFLALYEQL